MAIIKTKTLVFRATALGANPGEKQLPSPRFDSKGRIQAADAAWNRDLEAPLDEHNAYYGTDAVLNTKYVIDAKRHPVIGCLVELTSGRTVHYDVDLERIAIEGNQR